MIPNGDLWAASFLRTEPDYTEASWIDTYFRYIGICKPELTPEESSASSARCFRSRGLVEQPQGRSVL